MAFEARHADLLRRFVAAVPIPPPYSQGGTDDDRRAWVNKCAAQFKFSFPSEGWGTKSAHAARVPRSTDAICTREPFIGYDLILAGGADSQRVTFNPEAIDLRGQYFLDDMAPHDFIGGAGPVEPPPTHNTRLGASLFWGLGALRNGWPELDQQLAEYRDAGVDFVRTLIHLNSSDPRNPWKRIGLHAEDGDLEHLLGLYLDKVSSYGMKVEYTLLGGMADMRPAQQDRFVERFANGVRQRLHLIEFVEVMNEYRVNGGEIDTLKRMALRLREKLGNGFLLALSSPDATHNGGDVKAEVQAMQLHEANVITPHWNRHVNEPPDLGGFAPDFVVCNEPRGPSSSVAETDNPADIAHDYQAAINAGYYAYVLHSDSGVWSIYITDEWKDATRGQWPIFSAHRNGRAILDRVKQIRRDGASGPTPPPWTPPASGSSVLRAGERLQPGQRLTSVDGAFWLEYQADGNLVVYSRDRGPIWASSSTHTPGYVEMQTDGNFVIYDNTGRPRRASGTWNKGGVAIQLQPDGNLVMYRADGAPIWASASSHIYNEDGEPV